MVNVNIEVPDELHKRLKLASLLADKTLKDHIIDTLDRTVTATRVQKAVRRTRIRSARRRG